MPKLVSVIVPAFNEENLIEKTLISLKKQDYQSTEIIVVDNGSNDQTSNIAKKYANRVFYLKQRGVAKARNLGGKLAKGDFLMFLDADSRLNENVISRSVNFLEKGYIGGTARIIYESNDHKINFIEIVQNFCLKKWKVFETPFLYIKKEAFQKSKGWQESIQFGENMDFLRRTSRLGELKYDPYSSVFTSPRRFIKNKDYLYALSGGSLVIAGIKDLPFYPVRETEKSEKRKLVESLLEKKASLRKWKLFLNAANKNKIKDFIKNQAKILKMRV